MAKRQIEIGLKLEAGAKSSIESQIKSIKGKVKVALELDASEVSKIRNQLLTQKATMPVKIKLDESSVSSLKTKVRTIFQDAVKVRVEPENINAFKADTISSQIGTIQIKKIDASKAIAGVKSQLQSMMNALTVMPSNGGNGLAAFLGKDAIGAADGQAISLKQMTEEMARAKKAADKYKGSIKVLGDVNNEVSRSFKQAQKHLTGKELEDATRKYKWLQETSSVLSGKEYGESFQVSEQIKQLHSFREEMDNVVATHTEASARWKSQVEVLKTTSKSAESAFKSANKYLTGSKDLDKYTDQYLKLKDSAALLSTKEFGDSAEIKKVIADMQKYSAAVNQSVDAAKKAAGANKAQVASMQQVANLSREIQGVLSKNTRLKGTSYEYELKSMMSSLDAGGDSISKEAFNEYKVRYAQIQKEAAAAGKMGMSLASRMRLAYERLLSYGAISGVFYKITEAARSLYNNVVNIDTAMTQLRKVTDETESSYDKFFDGVSDRAKDIGATMSDTINASADFARLGYDIDTASSMADAALVYKNVGDNITDISQASESLTSTIQAFKEFGIEATDAMEVVDRFNEVGKDYCPAA